MAQAGLESKFGLETPPGSNNWFGIKAGAGVPQVCTSTTEGTAKVTGCFRKYDTVQDGFNHLGEVYKLSFYDDARKQTDLYKFMAMAWVGDGESGYATDPYYIEKTERDLFRQETGNPGKLIEEVRAVTKLGEPATHLRATGDFFDFVNSRVYSDPAIREAIINRHKHLYESEPDYPEGVYVGDEFVWLNQ